MLVRLVFNLEKTNAPVKVKNKPLSKLFLKSVAVAVYQKKKRIALGCLIAIFYVLFSVGFKRMVERNKLLEGFGLRGFVEVDVRVFVITSVYSCQPFGSASQQLGDIFSQMRYEMHVLSFFFSYFFADIDECSSQEHPCSQLCFNTWGSFDCQCNTGFFLGTDGRHCISKAPSAQLRVIMYRMNVVSQIAVAGNCMHAACACFFGFNFETIQLVRSKGNIISCLRIGPTHCYFSVKGKDIGPH